MGGYAWVTLATNDSYSLGALVLAHSLKQVGTKQQLAVLITPGVTAPMRTKLNEVFNLVKEVNILDSRDETNLKLLKRPELGVTFTKLHCWRLTQFEKCVFLDADTLVLENCDELFDREEFSAAPDIGWPDCFNSGVFVYRPSNETFEKLIQFAIEKGSFDGGDQGLLNLYFSDWAHKDISKHLPFIYNMSSTATYSYLPAFKQFGGSVKIIHFIGTTKPWLQYFDTESKKVRPADDVRHLQVILQHWWDIFCSMIHPGLSPNMTGIAGAFAKLTLGVPRTPEQAALDDHLRRQGWEVGNIDYLGRDSFDNIWSKICETLSTSTESAPKSEESSTPDSIVETTKEPAVQPESGVPVSQAAPIEVTPTPISPPVPIPEVKPELPVETPPKTVPVAGEPKAVTSTEPVLLAAPVKTEESSLITQTSPTVSATPIPEKPVSTEASVPSTTSVAVSTPPVQPVVVAGAPSIASVPVATTKSVTDSSVIPSPVAKQIKTPAAEQIKTPAAEAPTPTAPVETEASKLATPLQSVAAPVCPLLPKETNIASEKLVACPLPPKEAPELVPTAEKSEKEPIACSLPTKEIPKESPVSSPTAKQPSASPLPASKPTVCPLPSEAPTLAAKEPTPPLKEQTAPITQSKEASVTPTPVKEPSAPTPVQGQQKEPTLLSKETSGVTTDTQKESCPLPPKELPVSPPPSKETPVCPLPAKEPPVTAPPKKSKEPVTIPKAQVTEPTPPATPSAVQPKPIQRLPGESTPEAAPDASATGPTPPPRKGSGGTKKPASKKK